MLPLDEDCKRILDSKFKIESDDVKGLGLLKTMCAAQDIHIIPLFDDKLKE
jgi:hypothetical protein